MGATTWFYGSVTHRLVKVHIFFIFNFGFLFLIHFVLTEFLTQSIFCSLRVLLSKEVLPTIDMYWFDFLSFEKQNQPLSFLFIQKTIVLSLLKVQDFSKGT